MPLDPKILEQVFCNHFENLSPDEFQENLNKACPYLADLTLLQTDTTDSQLNLTTTDSIFDVYNVFESLSVLAGSDEFLFAESIASYDRDIEELEKLCKRYICMYENMVHYKSLLCDDSVLDRYSLERKIECQEILMKNLADRIYFHEQSMISIRQYFSHLDRDEHRNVTKNEITSKNLTGQIK
jgi:hypothetical protein